MKDKMILQSGGTGFQPVGEFKIYTRNLPHWQSPGSVYFITFRTFEDIILPESARDIVFNSILYWKDKKFNLYGAVVMSDHVHLILQPLEKEEHRQVEKEEHRQDACATGRTGSQPVKSFFSLAEILHSIKSYSSNQINKMLKRSHRQDACATKKVWLDENFDRIVRDDQELLEKMNYIMNNPVKVGLVKNANDYKWLYLEGVKEHRQDACATKKGEASKEHRQVEKEEHRQVEKEEHRQDACATELAKLGIRDLAHTPGKLITKKGPIDGYLSAFGTVWGKLKMTGDMAEEAMGFRPKNGAVGVLLCRRKYIDKDGKVKKGIFAVSLMPYSSSPTPMEKLNQDRTTVLSKIVSKHMNDLIHPIWEPLVLNKNRKPWTGCHYFLGINGHRVKLTGTRPGSIEGSLDWSKLLISNGKLEPPKRMYPNCYDPQRNQIHIALFKNLPYSVGIGLFDIITGDFLHISPNQIEPVIVPPKENSTLELTWELNQIRKHFHPPRRRFRKYFSRFYIYIYYKKGTDYSPSICSRVIQGKGRKKEKGRLPIIISIKYPLPEKK